MATAAPRGQLRKPVFVKVEELQPGTLGHTLVVKVVSSKMVLQRARPNGSQLRQVRIAECVVGDDTGVIIFTARNEQGRVNVHLQMLPMSNTVNNKFDRLRVICVYESHCFFGVDLMKEGETVIIRNAKIDMFKGTMRLAVDKWGRVEVTEPANFAVKEDNNLSVVEYELVSTVE